MGRTAEREELELALRFLDCEADGMVNLIFSFGFFEGRRASTLLVCTAGGTREEGTIVEEVERMGALKRLQVHSLSQTGQMSSSSRSSMCI